MTESSSFSVSWRFALLSQRLSRMYSEDARERAGRLTNSPSVLLLRIYGLLTSSYDRPLSFIHFHATSLIVLVLGVLDIVVVVTAFNLGLALSGQDDTHESVQNTYLVHH